MYQNRNQTETQTETETKYRRDRLLRHGGITVTPGSAEPSIDS